jgi:hypothetical protein
VNRLLLIPALFLLSFLFSCQQVEKGSLDQDILSRKAFECIRSNDLDKFRQLIPDREAYERYFHLKQMDNQDFESHYTSMRDTLQQHFSDFYQSYGSWDDAVYANAKGETSKNENVSEAIITTKFSVMDEVKKFSFSANKLNGRWYITGDFQWVQ